MQKATMPAKRFSLTRKISGSVDRNEDDLLYSNIDLARETRNQEVGNCWTYPTMNSFETSLISRGLVSSPNEFEGSEWHLSLHQTAGGSRGLIPNPKFGEPRQKAFDTKGQWGGFDYFGIGYFANGQNGAAVATSRGQRSTISEIVSGFRPNGPTSTALEQLYLDPYLQRQYT